MSHNDAVEFCKWYVPEGRLPTEAEWEYAARGGENGNIFPWGNSMLPDGKHRMNIWQSSIPQENLPATNFYINGIFLFLKLLLW